MARQPVGDLVVQGGALARRGEAGSAHSALDLRVLAARSPISAGAMVLGGLVALGVGLAMHWALHLTLLVNAVAKILVSVGAGTAVLGVLKRAAPPDSRPALPPAEDPKLVAERRRRLRAIMEDHGHSVTFEFLLQKSRWTQQAVLSTLLDMKERGEVLEDLDLDSGEWVYRPLYGDAPMLEERRELLAREEDRA